MPLTTKASDATDTTEEAVLALLKRHHDAHEAAGRTTEAQALADLARDLTEGEHWNVPTATSLGTTQPSHAGL